MAFHFVDFSLVKRSKDQNAVFTIAYDRGTKMYCERTGEYSKDYSDKSEVAHNQILIPQDAPEWVQEIAKAHSLDGNGASEFLWNKIEHSEKQRNSQVARRVMIVLPRELTLEQNKELMNEYLQENFCNLGMIADYSIHWGDGHNPHAHVLLTMRHLTEDGFGLKNRKWNEQALCNTWREDWAVKTNKHLAKNGHDIRIDHRSYKEQGLLLRQNIHLGSTTVRAAAEGVVTDRMKLYQQIKQENYERIKSNPEILLKVVGQQKENFSFDDVVNECIKHTPVVDLLPRDEAMSKKALAKAANKIIDKIVFSDVVFSERDLAKELNKADFDAKEFINIISTIKASKDLIYLGVGDDGRDRYTTKACFQQEVEMIKKVEKLAVKMEHFVDDDVVDKAIQQFQKAKGFELSDEQINAVKYLTTGSGDVACLVGKAGTGKTTVLTPCVAAFRHKGYRTIGVALANVAANNMKECGFDRTASVFSLIKMIEEYDKPLLDKNTVLVVDEASMIGSAEMAKLVNLCEKYGSKLLFIGDYGQLFGVAGGAPMKAIEEIVGGGVALNNIIRQKIDWQVEASTALAVGNVEDALKAYDDKGNIQFEESDSATKAALIENWGNDSTNLAEKIIMAHENADVKDLNKRARQVLVDSEVLKNSETLVMQVARKGKIWTHEIELAVNERVVFSKGGYINQTKIANNQKATVTRVSVGLNEKISSIKLKLDGADDSITLSSKDIRKANIELVHGYAETVHKEQGSTVDKAWCYASSMWDRALVYVAMTRHRLDAKIYASSEKFADFNDLVRKCARQSVKDSVLDYVLSYAVKRQVNTNGLVKRIASVATKSCDYIEEIINPEKYHARKEIETRIQSNIESQEFKDREKEQLRTNAIAVSKYLDANQLSGKAWAELKLYAMEHGYWDEENNRADLKRMQQLPIFLEARRLTNVANELADVLMSDVDKYKETLRNLGIDEEILKRKQTEIKFFDAISNYKQDKNRLYNAKVIIEILNNDTRYYPRVLDAELDDKQLKTDAKEYHRQELLKTLSGDELNQFRIIEQYDFKNSEASSLRRCHKDLEKHFNLTKPIGKLNINESNGIQPSFKLASIKAEFPASFNYKVESYSDVTVGLSSINNIKLPVNQDNINSANINIKQAISKNELEHAKQGWLKKQLECEKLAYEVTRAAYDSKGMQFYELSNDDKIAELQHKLEIEQSKEEVNPRKVNGIQRMMNYFVYREDKLKQNSERHQCLKNVLEYKQLKDGFAASKIRASLKDNFHKNYYLCKEHNINWNKLLTTAEQYDSTRIADTLNKNDKYHYKRVAEYLRLTRCVSGSFDYNMEVKYAKTKLANKIINNIDEYKEALEFYQISKPEEDKAIPKHQINNFNYLKKQAEVYTTAKELVNQYENEEDLDKKQELALKLQQSPYGSQQEQFLQEELDVDKKSFKTIGNYSELVSDTSLAYSHYSKTQREYRITKLDNLLGLDRDKIKPNFNFTTDSKLINDSATIINKLEIIYSKPTMNISGSSLDEMTKGNLNNVATNLLITPKEDRAKQMVNTMERFNQTKPKVIIPDNHVAALTLARNNYKEHISFEMVKELKDNWTEVQNTRNETAYGLRKVRDREGLSLIGCAYYQLEDNQVAIKKAEEILASADISNRKRQYTETQVKILTEREKHIDNHANIHQCHLLMNKYQGDDNSLNAANIRGMFEKDLYGLCFGLAKARKVNWNELLTKAENHDLAKIYPNLSEKPQQSFNKVKEYIELERTSFSKDTSYQQKAETLYKKAKLADDIGTNLEEHTEALKFYQIATTKDDDKYLKHEIKAFTRLNKEANKYQITIKLIDEHQDLTANNADVNDRLKIVEKLQNKSLGFIKNHHLSGDLKQTSFDIRNDEIRLKLNKEISKSTNGAVLIKEYFEADEITRMAWRAYFKDKDSFDIETAKGIKEIATRNGKITNELAYAISSNRDEYKELLKVARIKEENLTKQAVKHLKNQEPSHEQYINEKRQVEYSDKFIAICKEARLFEIKSLNEQSTMDWQLEFEGYIEQAKQFQHRDVEVKKNLGNDIKWLEQYKSVHKLKSNNFDYEAKRLAWARSTTQKMRAIKGTVAEKYLKSRNINIIPNSKDIGYGEIWDESTKQNLPALIAASRNSKGDITGCQVTYLNEDGTKADVAIQKQSRGHLVGSGACIQKGEGNKVALCEGTESALSVAQADKNLTVMALLSTSNFEKYELPKEYKNKDILICSDNDGEKAESKKVILKAVDALAKKGYDIYFTQPDLENNKKTDFNDISKEKTKKHLDNAALLQAAITKESLIKEIKEQNNVAHQEISQEQKQSFATVDNYLKLKDIEFHASTTDLQKAQAMHERAETAYVILQNIQEHQKALDFYEVTSQSANDELKSEASKYETTIKLIDEYQDLIKNGADVNDRLKIVLKLQDKSLEFVKQYHLSGDLNQTAINIKDDETRLRLEQTLVSHDANDVSKVQEYFESIVDARKDWADYLEHKDDKKTNWMYQTFADEKLENRNTYAYQIAEDKGKYSKLLEIANISDETLIKHAEAIQVKYTAKDIEDYQNDRLICIDSLNNQTNLAEWSVDFENVITRGKELQHQDDTIKRNLDYDVEWLEKLNDVKSNPNGEYELEFNQETITNESLINEIKYYSGLSARINNDLLEQKQEQTKNIEVVQDIRDRVLDGINLDDTTKTSRAIETALEQENNSIITDRRMELEAYKLIIEKNKDTTNTYNSIEEILHKEYQEIDSKIVPLPFNVMEQNKLEEQRAYIAKTIQTNNPEVPDAMQKVIDEYEQERAVKLKEQQTKEQLLVLDSIKVKVSAIFERNDNIEPEQLLETYQELAEFKENSKSFIEPEEIKTIQKLTKLVAREVQVSPTALDMAKLNNIEKQINKNSEIELKEDLISQYQTYREEVDERGELLPDPLDREAFDREMKLESDMLHLAKVISNREELHSNLSDDVKSSIQEHAKQQTSSQRMEIAHLSMKQDRGMGLGYSLKE